MGFVRVASLIWLLFAVGALSFELGRRSAISQVRRVMAEISAGRSRP